MHAPFIRFRFRHWAATALIFAVPVLGWAQPAQQIDPPSRVAYISIQEGAGTLATDSQGNWSPAVVNMPVTTGTRLASEAGSRTELNGGFAAFRLAGKANLEVIQLDDNDTRLALTEGTLSTRLRDMASGERFEIDTPNMALVANQPGEYRFDVDPSADTTRLSIHSGSATVYGDGGQAIALNAREQMVFTGRALQVVSRGNVNFRDAFDQWASSRERLNDQSASARYVSPAMPGYQQLDSYGDWAQDVTYGAVWYPRVAVADWAPYRYGRWTWVDPWGWTWVDDAPWGFAPFHYGRWAQIGPRWAWVPGPRASRPVYAPALVGFAGGSSGGASWNVSVGTAWFPLAPGEHWEPHYHASQRYRHALNPWNNARNPSRDGSYYFQRRPNAITAAPPNQFGMSEGRRPRFLHGTQVPQNEWAGTSVVPPPSRPRPEWNRHGGAQRPFPSDQTQRGPHPQQPAQPPTAHFPQRDPEAWRAPHEREPRQEQMRPPQQNRNFQQERGFQQQIDQQRAMQYERQLQLQREAQQRMDQPRQDAQRQQDQWRQQQQRQQWEQGQRQEQQRQRLEQQRDRERPLWERQHGPLAGQQREQVRPPQTNQGRPQESRPAQREERGSEQRRPAPRYHEGFN